MKIYAFNFCLNLQMAPKHGHFFFESLPFWAVEEKLRREGTLFEDQVFYVPASEASPERVNALLKDTTITKKRIELVLVFERRDEREDFLDRLRYSFKPSTAAGGMVVGEAGEILMILRDGLWDLPKGKVERREEIRDAAVREVSEETGIEAPHLGKEAAITWHIFERKSKWRWKETTWYWMTSEPGETLTPQTEEGITEVKWWSREKLQSDFPKTYPQIEALLRKHLEREGTKK